MATQVPQSLLDLAAENPSLQKLLEEDLDNAPESAIVNEKEPVEEEQEETVAEAQEEQPEKSKFDLFLDSLPNDAEREAAKIASQDNWNVDRWEKGGYNYREYNARKPLIESLKAQQEKIDKLTSLISKTRTKDLGYTKRQAEKVINQAQDRLRQARDNQDFNEAESAYTDLQQAREILQSTEEEIKSVSDIEPKQQVVPQMTEEYQAELNSRAKDFYYQNRDWIVEDSPDYDSDKLQTALKLERQILADQPGIKPHVLYAKLQIQLDNMNKKQEQEEPVERQVTRTVVKKKPAIESVSSVRSSDRKSRSISEGDQLVMQALENLGGGKPHSSFMSPKQYMALRGIK